jgi:muramidase (phage lysozyme)
VGSGKWADALMEFVDYAQESGQPTAIVNLSLDLTQVESDGGVKTRYEFTPEEREALEYARQNGVLVVVAAGNDGSVMSVLGQAAQEFDNIITVGATNGNQRADYSSYGRRGPDIMAEGGSIAEPILSTAGDNVGTMAGTSIATAQVTGAASLVWEANPELNYRQIIEALKSTATDLNVAGEDSETGAGLVNPDGAVAKAKEMTPEDYDPEEFLTPDTWGGEGLVTPEERAVEFNYPIVPESFSGTVNPEIGVNIRYSNSFDDRSDQNAAYGDTLYFDAWTWGEVGNDYWNNDEPDALWYRLEGTDLWVPSVYIAGYPGSGPSLLPPESSEPIQDEGDNLTSPGDSLIVYDENGYVLEIGGGDTGYGDSGSTSSEPSAPTFETYYLFEGAYDENAWIGAPIGDPYISANGFVSQEFENAYLEYNGSGIVYIYEKEAEESSVALVENEPDVSDKYSLSTDEDSNVESGKGSLIRTGAGDWLDEYKEITEAIININAQKNELLQTNDHLRDDNDDKTSEINDIKNTGAVWWWLNPGKIGEIWKLEDEIKSNYETITSNEETIQSLEEKIDRYNAELEDITFTGTVIEIQNVDGLTVRSGPGRTNETVGNKLVEGQSYTFNAWAYNEEINGEKRWLHLADRPGEWVSAYYIDEHIDNLSPSLLYLPNFSGLVSTEFSPSMKAFLDVIAYAEGTGHPDGYRDIVNPGGLFDSFDDHPREVISEGLDRPSTAAGRYQITDETWDEMKVKIGVEEFSPTNQDKAAVQLIKVEGAFNDVETGKFESAVDKVNNRWASFPGSQYGQPIKSMEELKIVYLNRREFYS